MPKVKKIRMFEIMNECERLDVQSVKSWLSGIDCKYLIVLHNQDLPRAPHFHIFVKMENARTIKDIASQLQIDERWIEIVKNWKNALAYAFHLTDNAKNDGKYQYDETAIVASCDIDINGIFKLSKEYQEQKARDNEIKELLFKYGECEISKNEVLKRVSAKDYDKHAQMFKRMQEYRIMKVRDRNMDVLYITGGAGSGKTTLAKFMASTMNYDIFVSGSGKDILDGYDKEECIILDDLRGDIFTKAELFKLTDNNTNSSVKSRFRNKDISYCKMMIITSVKSPKDLYNWDTTSQEDKDETFKQFARRIGNKFLFIDDRNGLIYECAFDTSNYDLPTLKTRTQFTMAQVFEVLGIKAYLGKDLFNGILAKVKERIEEDNKKDKIADDLPF